MAKNEINHPNHLAWHETMELHELVAFQSTGLMKMKDCIKDIKDKELRSIYDHTIKELEKNLRELLQFYSITARAEDETDFRNLGAGFYSAELLSFSKAAVKNYAAAITETATPELRETFEKQLEGAIETHSKVFSYMYKKGFYPAYDLEKLLQNDVKNAQKALKMS